MKDSLNRLSVFVDDDRPLLLTLDEVQTAPGLTSFLQTVQDLTDAPTDTVAASVFFRRIGFLLAAQFHIIAVHHKVFAGPLNQVGVIYNDYTFKFTVPSEGFIEVQDEELALQFVLDTYGHPLVEFFSLHAKIPKLILWENIWGYVLWAYSQLINDGVLCAAENLDFLLLDSTWKPRMRRSPFKQFLQNQSALEAMNDYKRVTCCLLKEMPNTNKCSYCPHAE